jgi:hypothetical protein
MRKRMAGEQINKNDRTVLCIKRSHLLSQYQCTAHSARRAGAGAEADAGGEGTVGEARIGLGKGRERRIRHRHRHRRRVTYGPHVHPEAV